MAGNEPHSTVAVGDLEIERLNLAMLYRVTLDGRTMDVNPVMGFHLYEWLRDVREALTAARRVLETHTSGDATPEDMHLAALLVKIGA